jgi:hypothetical protein
MKLLVEEETVVVAKVSVEPLRMLFFCGFKSWANTVVLMAIRRSSRSFFIVFIF